MKKSLMSVYVGMALTEAPKEFSKVFQHELKQALSEIGDIEILDFIGLENGTEVDVFEHDQKCTLISDLCVFVADYPSIGLGMEIAFRYESGRTMLVFAKTGKKITRMLTGALAKKGIALHRYDSVDDIARKVQYHRDLVARFKSASS